MPLRFTQAQIESVLEDAAIYMCACPAQVCREILNLRNLYRYQQDCVAGSGDPHVHGLIAESVMATHKVMEDCLAAVMDYEGWDRVTLRMPDGLRKIRDTLIEAEIGPGS
ncbi:hypothetical protein CU669_04795 [Paramagnetospirillum kuznetsovii]|uniref:Uncharacterized protein n=1 Tax=Paramagnetospirillum kuznetsovii TaxID=2053833 RepID=A0A364P347_9PROT|nr:hypothetical protein CU669_04795 [Paramagnetospirillum kuznetsovii]